MSYTINLRVINDTGDTLTLIEKTLFSGDSTWTVSEAGHRLSIVGSGTSGLLRFKSSDGSIFAVIVGVHNYKRWVDIVVDTPDSGVTIHPKYYNDKLPQYQELWKQASELSKKNGKGKTISVKYYVPDGNALFANLTYA